MRNLYGISILIFVLLSLICGCSKKGNPITPSGSDLIDFGDVSNSVIEDVDYLNSYGIIGLYYVSIDPESLTGELVPIRDTASQDVIEVIDLTNFLTIVPCSDCVRLSSVYLNADGYVTADIGIKHPFAAGNPNADPSASNRLDLHVFNVEGIVLMKSPDFDIFAVSGITVDKNTMVNASGYTNYLDNSLDGKFFTEADIHPYRLHFRDFSDGNFNAAHSNGFEDLQNPTGNLIMAMGCEEDIQPYSFDCTGTGSFEFVYAIGATYGISADSKSMRLDPIYYLPQYNKKAASEVSVNIVANNLFSELPTSWATVDIEVLDMNHGASLGTGLGDARALSNVMGIIMEIPGLLPATSIPNPTPDHGDPRDPDNPMTYRITFSNTAWATTGTYRGLVKVIDSYPPGLNKSPILDDKDGIHGVDITENPLTGLFDLPELVTYQVFSIEVVESPGNIPPIADLDASSYVVASGQDIQLYPGPDTRDPDGSIILYEYDFDYDGYNFDIDRSNTSGDPVNTDTLTNDDPYNPLLINMAMRVTDDGDPTGSSIDSIEITVEFSGNIPPVADLEADDTWIEPGENTNLFPGTGTNDPDGTITLYEYDFDYDGINFEYDAVNNTGEPVATPVYSITRVVTVAMRVTDDGTPGLTDIDELDITVGEIIGWARTWGGTHYDAAWGIAVGNDGSVYVTGDFEGVVDFDPDPGEQEIKTSSGIADAYLSKFNTVGEFQWVRTWGCNNVDYRDSGQSVTVDSADNVYVVGIFYGVTDFDPGSGVDEYSSNGYQDVFLTKFDSDGIYQWAGTWGGTYYEAVYDVHVDSFDNVYATGSYRYTVDFDPDDTDEDNHTSNNNSNDIYVTKLDPTGDHRWAVTWGSDGGSDFGYGVSSDSSGNAYIAGCFVGTCDFDPGSGIDEHTAHYFSTPNNNKRDAFLSKFDSNGIFIWANTWGENDDDNARGVTVDENDGIYVLGEYQYTVDFDPDPTDTEEHTAAWEEDIFVSKFDTTGDFTWVQVWGGTSADWSTEIAATGDGFYYVYGHVNGTMDFDPDPASQDNHTVNGPFLSKFATDGDYKWMRSWGGGIYPSDLDTDIYGNTYMSGRFWGTYDFDPGPGTWYPASYTQYDAYIVKVLPNGYWQ